MTKSDNENKPQLIIDEEHPIDENGRPWAFIGWPDSVAVERPMCEIIVALANNAAGPRGLNRGSTHFTYMGPKTPFEGPTRA